MKLLVTGGAGFIGSAFVRRALTATDDTVVNLDKLTYAGNLLSLVSVAGHPGYAFEHADICDRRAVADTLRVHAPDAIVHLAAESHVDRSIEDPSAFVQTNVLGTAVLLEEAARYWLDLDGARHDAFRFLHVSTDEVYGELTPDATPFTETSAYAPNSPYAASKAGADHLVRAWHRTYGLPVLLTSCSNNYGPYQFPEKLIPLMILNALEGRPLPVYGDGRQVRDWLFVDDHVDALRAVLARGRIGETYNIGGGNERANIDLVRDICALLDELLPAGPRGDASYADLITHVADRPGHDRRYAMDAGKLQSETGWAPAHDGPSGLRATVSWYLKNRDWIREVTP